MRTADGSGGGGGSSGFGGFGGLGGHIWTLPFQATDKDKDILLPSSSLNISHCFVNLGVHELELLLQDGHQLN